MEDGRKLHGLLEIEVLSKTSGLCVLNGLDLVLGTQIVVSAPCMRGGLLRG
jgi:hypothetical protein